jgi:hypothetical protein
MPMRWGIAWFASFAVALALCNRGNADERVSARFDGWIVAGGSKLIALMDDSSTPLVAISCSSDLGAYSLSVRVIDRRDVFADHDRNANYFQFLAWSDSGPAQKFTAVVPPEMPALAKSGFQQVPQSMKSHRFCGACSKHLESSSRTARRQVFVR